MRTLDLSKECHRIDSYVMEPDIALTTHQRRTKRLVPDMEKDRTYWEKRKRNNIAAKKSRENRRQYESLVRSRVLELEEENTILKKELEVIKERFDIPKDICVLSQSERDKCLEKLWKAHNSSIPSRDATSTSLNASAPNSSKYNREISRDEISDVILEDRHPQVNNFVWAVTPAYSQSLQRYAESSKIYRNEISYEQTTGYAGSSLTNKRKQDDDNMTPADLSTKRNRSTSAENDKRLSCYVSQDIESISEENREGKQMSVKENCKERRIMRYLKTTDSLRQSSQGEHCKSVSHEDNGVADAADVEDYTNSDIKNKLQLLSDQVERMQKLVCKTSA